MPHDKNGTVIEAGDGVRFSGWDGKFRVGAIASVHPSAQTCNVTIAVPVLGGSEYPTINADMCEVLTRNGAIVAWPVPSAAAPQETAPVD